MADLHSVEKALKEAALARGAVAAAVVPASAVRTDRVYREMCATNACGNYGRSWMCPPAVGDIDAMIASLSAYGHVFVFQTETKLDHPGTFEDFYEAGNAHNRIVQSFRPVFAGLGITETLFLGVGGCRFCPVCAKKTDEPCRHPESAISSLEAYGIDVSSLTAAAGMSFSFSKTVVLYYGAVFFRLPEA